MTDRKLMMLAVTAAAMLLITIALYSRGAPEGAFASGTLLIQGLEPERIAGIVIGEEGNEVTLSRRGGVFRVAEKDDYPASVEKVNDLLIACLEIRCASRVTQDAGNHAELGVAEGGAGAVSVSFRDAEGKMIIAFIKGKPLERGMGSYVRLLGEDAVYGTDGYLDIGAEPMGYIDTELASIKRGDVERVTLAQSGESYSISRDDGGISILEDIPEGKRAKETGRDTVFGALSSLYATDVARGEKLDVAWDATYECQLSSGIAYTVELALEDDKHFVKLSARLSPPQAATEEEVKKREAAALAAEEAGRFREKHAGWVYEISSYKAEKMRTPLEELLEDIPEAPDEVAPEAGDASEAGDAPQAGGS